LELRQLEVFLAVIDHSSVTKAAEALHLSPGAVSLQLHNIADELRIELFVRAGKRIVPTPAAFRLAEHARSLLHQMQDIRQEFEADPALDTRPFHFATGATTLIHRLGKPLRLLRKLHPKTPFQITVSSTEDMVSGLLNRHFDLALISLPYENENLEITPLFEEEMLILGPSVSRVQGWKVGTISPSALKNAQFLLYPQRSNMRKMIDHYLRELGIEPAVAMEADDTEAIKRLVECGFGYSILPESALRNQPRYFHVYRIKENPLIRRQALAMVKASYPRPLTRAVAQFLMDSLGNR
jgi:DNA-binding transcriptional LysR family regulator